MIIDKRIRCLRIHDFDPPVRLTATEWILICRLARSRGAAVSRRDLARSGAGYDRALDQHVARIRRKAGKGVILTLPYFGYRLCDDWTIIPGGR